MDVLLKERLLFVSEDGLSLAGHAHHFGFANGLASLALLSLLSLQLVHLLLMDDLTDILVRAQPNVRISLELLEGRRQEELPVVRKWLSAVEVVLHGLLVAWPLREMGQRLVLKLAGNGWLALLLHDLALAGRLRVGRKDVLQLLSGFEIADNGSFLCGFTFGWHTKMFKL
jgi:hypothetical protein